MNTNIYIYAVLANFFFAVGSQIYAHFSSKFSASWMNFVKAFFALMAFGLTITLLQGWHDITLLHFGLLLVSGAIGLGAGDIFLLKAFTKIGPGRTMILFGFQPLILGFFGYYV